jgi:hypothetical protein
LGELQKFDLLSLLRDILTGKGEVSLLLHRCDCSMLRLVVASREIKIFRTQKTFGFGLNNSNTFYNILLLKRFQIHIHTSTFDAALDFQLDLAIFNRSIFGPLVGQNSTLERRKMQLLGATILFYLASIWEYYLISGVNSEGWFLRSFFLISSQGYAILFVFSILAFSKSIALPSRVSGLIKILSAYSFPLYLLDSTVVK